MNLRRALFIAVMVAPWATAAAAQTPFPPAQETPFPPAGQTPFPEPQQQFQPAPQQQFQPAPQPQQQQEPPCMAEFVKLRDDAGSKARKIEAATKQKQRPSAQVACGLFNSYAAAEIKMIKYAEKNKGWCGIPDDFISQMKQAHARTDETRDRICQVAAAPPRPAGPSLSEALGATAPTAGNIKTGHGTFDTLTGTPLGER
jgi:hypothetical protein